MVLQYLFMSTAMNIHSVIHLSNFTIYMVLVMSAIVCHMPFGISPNRPNLGDQSDDLAAACLCMSCHKLHDLHGAGRCTMIYHKNPQNWVIFN